MRIVDPSDIRTIDEYAIRVLGISEEALILRAGEAVADCVLKHAPRGDGRVLVLCGGGNNGADGYAAALALLARGFSPTAVDIFGKGQRSEGGRAVLNAYKARLGEPLSLSLIKGSAFDIVIDAVFGTGFSGELPEAAIRALRLAESLNAYTVAVDVPLGVDAALGEVSPYTLHADLTVVLSFMKRGLLSYPAAPCCGKTVLCDIGLDRPEIHTAFPRLSEATDDAYAREHLPKRPADSHKGSFGRACLFVGSAQYKGAALLAAEAALRGGAGLLSVVSDASVVDACVVRLPEALYETVPSVSSLKNEELAHAIKRTDGASTILVGCGCGVSEGLLRLVLALLSTEGAPLLLDADAINALALRREEGLLALKEAKRTVLLTPHPLELSRLSGHTVSYIQSHRMRVAWDLARTYGVHILLKGARTVIATPNAVHLNVSGSSALAKGGTGDVLSGLITALLSQGASAEEALRLGAYLHGKAADTLEKELTAYGVLPSELPRQIAREIASLYKNQ